MSAAPKGRTAVPAAGSSPDAGTSTRKLARQGSANLLGALISALAGFAVVVVVTRTVGKAEAGAFFAATSLFLIVCAVARLGTPTGVVWALSRYRALGQTDRVRPMLRAALLPVAVVSLAAGLTLLLLDPQVAGVLLKDDSRAGEAGFVSMVQALALFVPVAAVYDTVVAATRGYGTMRATVLVERIARPTAQLFVVGLAALGSSAVWLAAAWALPYLPALGVALVLLARLLRRPPPVETVVHSDAVPMDAVPTDTAAPGEAAETGLPAANGDEGRPAESVRREFWRFTAPRSVATIAQMASQRLDIVLLGALRGPVEAALYTAATRFLVVGQTAGMALSLSAQPTLGGMLARGDLAAANRVYRTATAWLVMLTWPLYLSMLVAAPVLLSIFGEGYEAGLPVMALLSLAMLIATACGMVDMVLTMAGRTTWNLYDMLLALGVQIVLDVLLIPTYGIRGAAYGWAAAIVLRNVLALVQIRVWAGMHPFGRGTMLAGALAATCFGAIPALLRVALGGSVPAVFAALTVGLAVYGAGLWWLRGPLHLDELPLGRRLRRATRRLTRRGVRAGRDRRS